jgi:DNA segregation ATPase FtsK/SpoIIIE, S-DNA-T family
MAKRRRKRTTYRTSLRYEIYGILFITLSVIAFSGEAAVGRSLSKLFGFVLGNYYFILALTGVWVGLYVMMKRAWPRGWTTRRTGFALLACSLALWSAMSAIDNSLGVLGLISPKTIVTETWMQLKEQLWDIPPQADVPMSEKHLGGGLVGALQYAVYFWMFGYYGAKLMLIVQLAISVLLMTNRSYVDMFRTVRLFFRRVSPKLAVRLSAGRKVFGARAVPVGKAKRTKTGPAAFAPYAEPDDMAELEAETPVATASAKKKTPLFFQLFHGKPEPEPEFPLGEDWDHDQPVLYGIDEREKRQERDGPFPDGEQAGASHGSSGRHGSGTAPVHTGTEDDTGSAGEEGRFAGTDAWRAAGPADAETEARVDELGEDGPAGETALPGSSGPDDPNGAAASGDASKPLSGADGGAAKSGKPYRMPPISLLSKPQGGKRGAGADVMETARKLEATLESFGVRAKVLDVTRGPAVTRYEVQPDVGVKVSRIVGLTDDIALALAAKDIRMEAPIPGKSAIGIEVPNPEISIVTLREVLESDVFQEAPGKLTIAFGRDISGQPIVGNLARMPHLLVAGATGSGKSVCINAIIVSLLYKARPDEVKLMMIDPKMVELNVYNGIPHLLAPVVTDPRRASLALKKIVVEMEKRYEKFSATGTRNIEGYNALMTSRGQPEEVLPYIVVIVDELADLMMVAAGDVEDSITRLAQMARAAGIHLIIATQRPSVDVITGVIKANIPSRIAFGVSSQVDSRTILDMAGAEKLLGRGDMLFLPMGATKPIRVQGAFVSDAEVEKIVNFVRGQAAAEYNEELVPEIEEAEGAEAAEELDELFDQAVRIVLEAKQASVSLLQRRLRIGYTRAARLIDTMEARGIVGPYEGSKPREVLMTPEQYDQLNNRLTS